MTRKDYSPEADHACVQGQLHNVKIKSYKQHGREARSDSRGEMEAVNFGIRDQIAMIC